MSYNKCANHISESDTADKSEYLWMMSKKISDNWME